MRSKWVGKALCSFVGTAVLELVVSTGSPLIMGALASPDDEFVTQEDLKALKEEVKTLKDELKSIKAVKSEEAPAITGNVYSELSRKIKLGGEIRTRFEGLMNFDFTGSPNDTFSSSEGSFRDITLLRTRLNVDADINDYLRAFLELQDNRAFGDEDELEGVKSSRNSGTSPSPAALQRGTLGNLGRVDLLQGFVELKSFSPVSSTLSGLSLLIGRWRMSYGKEHLIGPLDWSNQGRAWDGARIRWSSKDSSWIDGFITQIDKDFLTGFPQATDRDEVFWGVYGHCTSLKDYGVGEIEPYFIGRNNANSMAEKRLFGIGGTDITKENRYTAGLRLAGEPPQLPGLDYEVDGLIQYGGLNVSGSNFDINQAYAFYAIAGYTVKDMPLTPRFGGGITYATGTSDSELVNKGELNTFDQLYPTGHRWLGYMDLVGWQNIIDYMVNLSAKPTKKWLLKTDLHFFYLEEPADAWYNAGGLAIAAWDGTGSKPNDQLGQELDVVAKYAFFKNFDVEFGYSHFFQGNFMEDDNVRVIKADGTFGDKFGNSDADWFYVMTTLRF
ncbi:MAG TPA: alginate export family protein [Candidatus Brocadiia bacterium]|nr:alginate export family protein [Candidatus Brocadiales bacterium]